MVTAGLLEGSQVLINCRPEICPLCSYGISPMGPYAVSWVRNGIPSEERLEAIFRCPRTLCQSMFVGYYVKAGGEFELSCCAPRAISKPLVDERIAEISPSFVEIFAEAHEAELRNLKFICGPGYRKALEYLIKDYLIGRFPTDEEAIRREQVGACIETRIDDGKVRLAASRAAWLGNDETHYDRKWPEKDVNDLKKLIQLTENSIVNSELIRELEIDMPARGTTKKATNQG